MSDSVEIPLTLPTMVLVVMVMAVLLPSASYSFSLNDPTPAELLVAICIGVFSSTVCLWILDAVSVLRFRSEWVSRGVWGAAIVSILGTGVGVFQGALAERKYLYEGAWTVRVLPHDAQSFIADHSVVLIVEFLPEKARVLLRLLFRDGSERAIEAALVLGSKGKQFRSGEDDAAPYSVTLVRSR